MIDPKDLSKPVSITVYNEDEFVDACRRAEGKYNIYVGINERTRYGTRRDDVQYINAVVIDVDSLHPPHLPSTNEETFAAYITAEQIYNYLRANDKDPYMAMSGNGWQIWVKTDIKVANVSRLKIERIMKDFQGSIITRFTSSISKIDNIGDLARVIKVIGTTCIKKDTWGNRPFRESYWKVKPYSPKVNVEWGEKLLSMANELPEILEYDTDVKPEVLDAEKRAEYLSRFDDRTYDIYDGNWQRYGYSSRSEAEMALVCRMAILNIEPSHAWGMMDHCKIGKWRDAKWAYKKLTIQKAYSNW